MNLKNKVCSRKNATKNKHSYRNIGDKRIRVDSGHFVIVVVNDLETVCSACRFWESILSGKNTASILSVMPNAAPDRLPTRNLIQCMFSTVSPIL